MAITFRNYTNKWGITDDYYLVRDFFIRRGYCEFTYARWDWMITHGYLDRNSIGKIGLWNDNDKIVGYAVIEPVATDPDYRRMGLGKAVVLEGIKRVIERGAKLVFVGSSQQFYYSIGLRPYSKFNSMAKK